MEETILKVFAPTAITFVIGILITPFITFHLYRLKAWKKKSGKGKGMGGGTTPLFDKLHKEKDTNTPRMGGIVIWASVFLTIFLISFLSYLFPNTIFSKLDFLSRSQTWLPLFGLFVGAVVGFLDDLLVIRGTGKHFSGGLPLSQRLIVVAITATFSAWWFYTKLDVSSVSFFNFGPIELGWLFIPFFIFVAIIVYASSIIDGVDGLAGGVFLFVFTAYTGIAFYQSQFDLAALCATITGGILAFLWFNIPPARFYMTETGVLALTMSLTIIAFMTDTLGDGEGVSMLPIVGFLLIMTVFTNVIQLVSKKFFGKKVFLVAPIHHHFEALGWSHAKVAMRYWVLGFIFAIIGLLLTSRYMTIKGIDRTLLTLVLLLVTAGFFIFSSASLGLLSRGGASFSSVAFSQIFFGIIGGSVAMFIMSQVYYRNWRQYAFYIFIASMIITMMVFIPGIGFSHGGAQRWINIGSFSFQPAEILKFAFIIYMATWLSGTVKQVTSVLKGTLPFVGFVGLVGAVLLLQPDTDTFMVIAMSATAMFIVAGGRWRDVFILGLTGVLLLALLAFSRPYIKDRLTTFLNPDSDPLGSGYQINQSLIAVGSGGFAGRGFGQSIQKFEYLPEPTSDSIFAVYAEEFGFIGSFLLIALFSFFTFRGYRIASLSKDLFGMLLVVGIMTVIVAQSFLNIAAMLAMAPLSGLPLPFISHGGTALLTTLAAVGIVLNVSKYQKNKI